MASKPLGSGGWKDTVAGIAFLCVVGFVFTGIVATVSGMIVGH